MLIIKDKKKGRSILLSYQEKVKKVSFSKVSEIMEIPDLVSIQRQSYKDFLQMGIPPVERKDQGLQRVLRETFPIEDFNGKLVLEFVEYYFGKPKYTEQECREKDITWAIPFYLKLRLIHKKTGEIREQDVFMRNIPVMTNGGTFIINGAERVVVSQLHRSPGVFFDYDKELRLYSAKIVPYRGVWVEFEISANNVMYLRLARKKKVLASLILRALGYETNEEIISLFYQSKKVSLKEEINLTSVRLAENIIDKKAEKILAFTGQKLDKKALEIIKDSGIEEISIIDLDKIGSSLLGALERDETKNKEEASIKIYNLIRTGEASVATENAQLSFNRLFFDPDRYNLGKVGRYKTNQRLNLDIPVETTVLTKEDIIETIRGLMKLSAEQAEGDDIDHLGNRRVRSIGELLENQLRVGFARLERGVRERMTIQDVETMTPQSVISIKPISASINEFFGSSQLSQFMDQTNPLAGLTHKRRLSALGQGGLSKERAGFEVRDVHYTHYGRICPIETPEGPNIGLIVSLATYAKTNEYGFIESPYRVVKNGRILNEVKYLFATEEDKYYIATTGAKIDKDGYLIDEQIPVRHQGEFSIIPREKVDFIDVSFRQLVSIATNLIPFLEHNDANRALMGSNMQRQAVSLLYPEVPCVATGIEEKIAKDSGACVVSEVSGMVTKVSGNKIEITDDKGEAFGYELFKYKRSNQTTCINQHPLVKAGERVEKGDIIGDGMSTKYGQLSLGKNLLVAFMSWGGYNFEDAILISERLLKDDVYTSIHIEKFEVEARDTQLGPESITRDIPNLGEGALANLDKDGIIKIGTKVKPGSILAGKVTPKGEAGLSPEYKLLYSIFGEKAREVRDTSLRVPYGIEGTVIDVKVFSQRKGDDLSPGVEKLVKVYVAMKRKITVGDKMAGRHGNKGVISKILPIEDMPFLKDGTPVDIVLNSLSVPSRMNLGQVLETHLGWAAHVLGIQAITPVFYGASEDDIKEYLKKANLPENGKVELYDGRTGEPFDQKVTVGYIYIMKLAHLAEDKIHARSTGPYSLVTQQPLGGKAQFGGQRLGEMEVWALEAYGAAYCLQELLTVKSDDITGRAKAYEAIVKGEISKKSGIPESFNVLVHELQGLALNVQVVNENGSLMDVNKLTKEEFVNKNLMAAQKLLGKK
ncbi:DNA-directed RNA polymerase subunit beta [bacterium]|nr:DNA-directed RNA polymerase subunit beta [bacterium]MBU1153654.1 DNA-directed RNA polymerase subunit beta [bacterium]